MSSIIRKALSVLGVTAAIAAGVSLGGGTAMAATPKCTATLKPGWGCLAVENKTSNPKLRSLRLDGTCIPDLAAKKRYATGFAVAGSDVRPNPHGNWLFYTGSNCEGGTLSGGIALSKWSSVNKSDNYVTVTAVNS
jgi:hypothetical protein